jgi:hypothetical protein
MIYSVSGGDNSMTESGTINDAVVDCVKEKNFFVSFDADYVEMGCSAPSEKYVELIPANLLEPKTLSFRSHLSSPLLR